jgi:hypothetical protein
MIVAPPGVYAPIDAFDIGGLPNLSRYGVRYGAYAKALESESRYDIGQKLTFAGGGSARLLEKGSWSNPEPWATWGEGQDFGIKLPFHSAEVPSTLVLEAQLIPNLSPAHPKCQVEVSVNGTLIGVWSFDYEAEFRIRTVSLPVPRELLTDRQAIDIHFHMQDPVLSPSEMGKGSDPRKLALAFVSLGLYQR